jgi:hypothetical protein
VYVLLEGGESPTNRDESSGEPRDQSELIAVLREQLAAEREANRENRRIIAGLVQRIPELEAAPEPPQAPESAPEASEGASPRPDTVGAQEGVEEPERKPWWRRWFGG